MAIGLLACLVAGSAAGHSMSGCRTSNLGGGTCQKHSHSKNNLPSMPGYNTNRDPAMGIDGDVDTRALRVKPPGEPPPEPEPCSLIRLIFVGCPM